MPAADLVRQTGVTERTFCLWKKKYAELESDQIRKLKQVQDDLALPRQWCPILIPCADKSSLAAHTRLPREVMAGGGECYEPRNPVDSASRKRGTAKREPHDGPPDRRGP